VIYYGGRFKEVDSGVVNMKGDESLSTEKQYVTVSAMIPRKLKELLDKYGIKPGPVIRRALEEEVKKHILAELEERVKGFSEKLSHISDEEVVSLIHEDREKR
jgi:polyhydroxyalkanoate synthesis regulator phasin